MEVRTARDGDPRVHRSAALRRASARAVREDRACSRRGRGPVSHRTGPAVPRRERRRACRVRAGAPAARSARSEERRGRDPSRAHGGAVHAVGREASRSRRADRARAGHCWHRAVARARSAPGREVVHAAARSEIDRRGLGGIARDRERGARHRRGARAAARAVAVPRRGRLCLPRAGQLPRGVPREPAPAADRPVPAGQRRAHRRAHDGRDLGPVARGHERGDGACRERDLGR